MLGVIRLCPVEGAHRPCLIKTGLLLPITPTLPLFVIRVMRYKFHTRSFSAGQRLHGQNREKRHRISYSLTMGVLQQVTAPFQRQ
ncbi:hypothetical protein PISMIDRAFT_401733 [Pisolithus microcarpus 441]|uniref:Uncharacterized protein n=1 Tax=Pisolithus microcarpus 441 TaxID=765257 RepID=A0A0C9Z5Y4_9AGAM|nr:hypothetical protein PISMIDRAFT_401733 [Pisolithus microcarpus 441]